MGWGVEIEAGRVRVCQAALRGGQLRLGRRAEALLPPETVQPGLKEPNLKGPAALRSALQECCAKTGCRGWVGLALPDAVFSLRTVTSETLPPDRAEARRFLAWQAKELLPFPAEEARLDFLSPEPAPEGRLRVTCLVARERVVREYEELVEQAGLRVALLDSASLSLTAAAPLPAAPIGLLNLREERSTFLLLEGARPRFWRILPYGRADWTGADRTRALRDLADSIAYCEQAGPAGALSRLDVHGAGEPWQELASVLEGWLRLAVAPLRLGADAAGTAPDGLAPWAAVAGTGARPW